MTSRRTRRLPEIARGVVALLALAGILLGVPFLLVSLTGTPVPRAAPSLDSVVAMLQRRDDGTLFIGIVRAITWLAWAYITLSVLVEFGAQLRGRRAPRLPGLGSLQRLAAKQVAAVLIAFGAGVPAAVAATPTNLAPATATHNAPAAPMAASPLTAQTPPSEPTSATSHTDPRATDSRTIKQGDTLWGIAEQEYGHGERYPTIFKASRGMQQPSGLPRITDPDEIQPGQRVIVPRPGGRSAPKPSRPPAEDPPGRSPSPGSATSPPSTQPAQPAPPTRRSPGAETPHPHASAPQNPSHSAKQPQSPPASTTEPSTPASPAPGAGSGTATRSTPPPRSTAPSTRPQAPPLKQPSPAPDAHTPSAPTQHASPSATENHDRGISFAAIAGVSALAAAGILAVLGVKRVLQQRRRRPGRRIKLPESPMSDLELQLRASESPADAAFLDRALRSLAAGLAAEGRCAPELAAARLTATGLELRLATPSPPVPPFVVAETPLRWTCPSTSTELLDDDVAGDTVAPYPALVAAGFDDDDNHVLLDLESIGALCLRGSDTATIAVLNALAVELATSVWADDIAVHLVGFSDQLPAAIGGDRLRHVPHIDDLLPDLEALSIAVAEVLDDSGVESLRAARTLGVAGDAWTPQIVLIGQPLTAQQAARLEQLAHRRSSVVAVVAAAGDHQEDATLPGTSDAWNIQLSPRWEPVELPEAETAVRFQRLMPEDYQHLLGVLRTADDTGDVAPTTDTPPSPGPVQADDQQSRRAGAPVTGDVLVARAPGTDEEKDAAATPADTSSAGGPDLAAGSTPAPPSLQKSASHPPSTAPSNAVTPELIEQAEAFAAGGGTATLPILEHKFHLTRAAALELMDVLQERAATTEGPEGRQETEQPPAAGPDDAPVDAAGGSTAGPAAADPTPTLRPLPFGYEEPPAEAASSAQATAQVSVPSPKAATAPQVNVLGPVTIVGADGDGGTRRASLTELAAYLVLHPGCDHHMLTEAIWPGRRTDAATRNSQVSRLRRWLGTDPDGNPYLPLVTESGRYTLADSVTSDWSRFRSLATQGLNAGPAGHDKLWRALDLVKGQPFAGVNPRRYVWAEYLRQEMISSIVDVAHSLAESRLDARDSQGAKNAAAKGLLAAPESELLWCDLILAEHQAGDMKGVEAAIDRLTSRNDELGLDLESRTIEVLQHVLHASRNASAAG